MSTDPSAFARLQSQISWLLYSTIGYLSCKRQHYLPRPSFADTRLRRRLAKCSRDESAYALRLFVPGAANQKEALSRQSLSLLQFLKHPFDLLLAFKLFEAALDVVAVQVQGGLRLRLLAHDLVCHALEDPGFVIRGCALLGVRRTSDGSGSPMLRDQDSGLAFGLLNLSGRCV